MTTSNFSIRDEQPSDRLAIRSVHRAAFGSTLEADLVDSLRETCPEQISLVAAAKGGVVGHILFTPAVIPSREGSLRGWALGPMAVLPEFQRQGIGTLMVNTGLDELRRRRAPFVVVLGHPHYYPRFGFTPARQWQLRSEWDVPDEVFMILLLKEGGLEGAHGMVRYHPAFQLASPPEPKETAKGKQEGRSS